MNITLDKDHIYRVDGAVKPSASSLLDLYFPPAPYYTEEGRDRGTARHEWYHVIAQGLEIENEPDDEIAAEVEGFRKFMREVRPGYIFGERKMFCPSLGFCGTPDLYCTIDGRPSLIDFKPANAADRWKLQTAAYAIMLAENGHPVLSRYALRLLPGDYRMDAHKDPGDLPRFRAMAAGYFARRHYAD